MYDCELGKIPSNCTLCRANHREMCYECWHYVNSRLINRRKDDDRYVNLRGVNRTRGTGTRIVREISGISL